MINVKKVTKYYGPEPSVHSYPLCGKEHRSVQGLARCMWQRASFVVGDGNVAVVRDCAALTVVLCGTAEEYEQAKRDGSCGVGCKGAHKGMRMPELKGLHYKFG